MLKSNCNILNKKMNQLTHKIGFFAKYLSLVAHCHFENQPWHLETPIAFF